MENEDGFIFNLTKKLSYSKDGEPGQETATLEFRTPGMNDFEEMTNLSQLVMNAIVDVQSNNTDNENQEEPAGIESEDKQKAPTGGQLKALLMASVNVKFYSIAKVFKILALKTCTLDGKTKLTDLLISRIGIQDYTRLVCEYISFFIWPSLLSDEGESIENQNGVS